MRFRFKRFQYRLLFFLISLLVALQVAIYLSVRSANIVNAKVDIDNNLQLGAEVFDRIISERTQDLFQYASLLSADYAFKPAFHSGDHATILSAMENHLARLDGTQIMLLVDLDSKVIANTYDKGQLNTQVEWPDLIKRAEKNEYAEATGVVMLDNQPYQIIVVPYFSPDISAWIMIGFSIDQQVARELKSIVQSEISFVSRLEPDNWKVTSSTLLEDIAGLEIHAEALLKSQSDQKSANSYVINRGDDELISLIRSISHSHQVYAVLQRSLNQALIPYRLLEARLQKIFWITLISAALLILLIAHRVTSPVKRLTDGAKKIEAGDYQARINVNLKDEIGTLADSFNSMAKGLEEKEKVRNLLGKVVSKEIAEELLSREIELGGEEKQATILFSDIRSFTSICEDYTAKEILSMLNVYLTEMSEAIEENKGVIDKYIGDAIMALFGTPVSDINDANHAIAAAMSMSAKLKLLNRKAFADSISFQMGIGINSGKVVAGNMGSPSRLNYTVVGDAVNLASRLEGLTKYYGVEIVVSESTKAQASDWGFLELDKVKVKGKEEPIHIYTPLCLLKSVDSKLEQYIENVTKAIQLYREQQWRQAAEAFNQIQGNENSNLADIYLERIHHYEANPPEENWDHSYRFESK